MRTNPKPAIMPALVMTCLLNFGDSPFNRNEITTTAPTTTPPMASKV